MRPCFRNSSFAGIPSLDLMLGNNVIGRLSLRGESSPQKKILSFLLSEGPVISPRQIHSDLVLVNPPALPERQDGDGILLYGNHFSATIQVADCLPVLISGESPFSWRLLLHSGFKGTILNIARKAFETLKVEIEGAKLGDSHAWIGPGIGGCCYDREISDPWTTMAMQKLNPRHWHSTESRVKFRLAQAIREQLAEIGVPLENIASMDSCTLCEQDRYCSYRGGDLSDRMVLFSKIDYATFPPMK